MKKYLYEIDPELQSGPAKLLRAVGEGKSVLEIGCASGVQTRILKEQYRCTVTGIEIDPAAAVEASKYCERVIVGDLESLDLSLELNGMKFDVITIADVLEHLRDPLKVLVKLRAQLRTGGYIVASIPNVVHAGLILQMAHGRFDYRPYGLLDDTHLKFFTIKAIYRLFEKSGFLIRNVDRALCPVESSEFSMHAMSTEETSVLNFIRQNNPEWQTYQFIVEAVPIDSTSELRTSEQLEAVDQLKDAELTVSVLNRRVQALEGHLTWIESHPIYRTLLLLKRLVFFGKSSKNSPPAI